MLLPNHEGKITITFKLDFDETDEFSQSRIKEGTSFKSSANFTTLEQLEEKTEITCNDLKKRLSDKFPANFKQQKLVEES